MQSPKRVTPKNSGTGVTKTLPGWQFSLIAIGSLSNIIYAHVPLVGLAAVAGNTLPRSSAFTAIVSIWLANQLYGLTIRQYPWSGGSWLWGLVMGGNAVLITWLTTNRPNLLRGFWSHLLWLITGVIGGYAFNQSIILLVAQWLGEHGITGVILRRILVQNLSWAIALFLLHSVGLWWFRKRNPRHSVATFREIQESEDFPLDKGN